LWGYAWFKKKASAKPNDRKLTEVKLLRFRLYPRERLLLRRASLA